MKPPKTVIFFMNGNTAAFDDMGQQMSHFQQSWFSLYIHFLQQKGFAIKDLTSVCFEMPDGEIYEIFETELGFNWKVKIDSG